MKQKLLNKLWLRVGMIVAVMTTALSGTVWAEEEVYYTLDGTQTGGSNGYATESEITQSNITWMVTGNTTVNPWRIGGKNLSGVDRLVYSTSTMSPDITKVVVTNGTATATVNSMTLVVSSNSDFSNPTSTVSGTWTASSTTTFERPSGVDWSNKYFKLIYNVTAGGSNQYAQLVKAEFYYNTGGVTPPSITAANLSIAYDVTEGEIEYTINNPVTGGTLSASTTADWITLGTATSTTVPFTCTANDGAERTATVTLTYTYGSNQTATKNVTVTQTANPNAPGTENNPYTVAQARAAIDAGAGVTNVYATGIVSEIVTAYNSTYSNVTFDIIDEGSNTTLRAYRCGGAGADEVRVNDVVVVSGNLTKYSSTYEFGEGCTLVSLTHPTIPTITVNPASLSDFIYEAGNGPSTTKTFTVEGANLTENITMSLGNNSDFEMSTTESSGYTNSLTLTQSAGEVAATTVYVRIKSDLAEGDYDGTITLSSTGATTVEVSLSGRVTAPEAAHVTWNLSIDETATASTTEMTWTSNYATMAVAKGNSSTATNNYYPGTAGKTYTSTRFYSGSNLTITPALGYVITSIVFEATSNSYAAALKNSTWTNAAAAMESGSDVKTVTVTPTDGATAISAAIGGTCGFTEVKVYYEVDNTTYYNINLDDAVQNGSIAADKTEAAEGATVTLTATPDTYYTLTGWTVLDGNADEVTVTVSQEDPNVATFTMPASDVEVSATFATTVTFYEVAIDTDIEHGTVVSDKATAAEGEIITLTVTPDTNYSLNEILVVPDGTGDVDVTKVNNTTYTFEMPADNVTITADFVGVTTNTYTLATAITSGKHYVIASGADENGYVKVMGTQNTNNRAAVDGSVDGTTLSVISNAGAVEFVIYGPDASGFYTIYDGTGYLYAAASGSNHLKTEATVDENGNGEWKITFGENGVASIVAENSSNRNVMQYNSGSNLFSCYASASQTNVYLYEKANEATPTESKTLNGSGYATYCSQNALDFTNNSDVTAWVITAANSTTGEITFSQIEGKVPAGTGMLLKGSVGAEVTISSATGAVTAPSSNLLVGTTADFEVENDGDYYGLKGNTFVPVTVGTVPAGKALLPASALGNNVKAFTFVFEDDATGIEETLSNSPLKGENIYNLAGQMVNGKSVNGKLPKGIYIVNGKKILK